MPDLRLYPEKETENELKAEAVAPAFVFYSLLIPDP
jgi:hypothetical protein